MPIMRKYIPIYAKGGIAKFDVGGKIEVYDADGNVQGKILGGNRIFSIENTEEIINLSKKVIECKKKNKSCELDFSKQLGKKVAGFIRTQDTRPKQYVKD